jgi:isoleucyl-tRNA synthetase
VWTTTPWTLTANVAVALNPELTYVRAKSDDRVLILSKGTVSTALKPGYEVLEEIPGHDLIGLYYSGPFDDIELQQQMNESTPRRSVAWEDVGEDEGTGIVHIAPGCGAEDFELGKREGLGFIVPVTPSAHFLPGAGELSGQSAIAEKDSNGNLVNDIDHIFHALERRDRMYRIQRYKHSYPHCWRCSHELIFNAVKEWFIRADAGPRPARQRLRAAARTVEWMPEYAGKRMDDWLANMGDWCISRKRFWGLPLPIYMDEKSGEIEVIGTRAELRERAVDKAKFDALPELHRPWIDDVEILSRDGQRVLKRVPEVGDAWLDAGIVPFSTVGFNGCDDIRMPELQIPNQDAWQPADFITEMREQVRLWFFSMLFMSVALEDRAPYKRAMVYETMLDENGERISKTKGNGVPYDEAVRSVGADPMRWTFCSNTLTKDIRFGYKPIHESVRRLLTLWNVYSFFVTYANLDKPQLSSEYSQPKNILDKWILARLQSLISNVTSAIDNVQPAEITRSVEQFVDELSNWYVRRGRRRFWKSESDEDKQAAYQTLHRVLMTVCQLIAPVVPFTAEAMYQNLKAPLQDAPQSVHLCSWPQVEESLRNSDLIQEVEGVLQCVSLGHAARKDSGVKVRQPLRRVLVQTPSVQARTWVENWRDTILDELNVKELELLDDAGELVEYSLKANLPKLGKKLGKQTGVVRQAFEGASPEEARRIGEASRRGEEFTLRVGDEEMTFAPDEVLVQTEQKSGYQFASENGWAVALDTTLDQDLIDEGLARDFVRAIQQARKDAGFQVSDRIAILLAIGEDSRMPHVFENWGDYIQNETLAEELRLVPRDYPELLEVKIGDETVHLRVERLAPDELATDESAPNENEQ